jgi:hypothetical protein
MVGDLADCLDVDQWEFEELLEQVDELSRAVRQDGAGSIPSPSPELRRTEPSRGDGVEVPVESSGAAAGRAERASSLPWVVLTIGLATLVCGSILIGWSLLEGRPRLWTIGLPLVLGGQIAIAAVVIWQFESVWQTNKATFCALHGLDDQVRQLHHVQAESREGRPSHPTVHHRLDHQPSPDVPPHVTLVDLQRRLESLSHELAEHARSGGPG